MAVQLHHDLHQGREGEPLHAVHCSDARSSSSPEVGTAGIWGLHVWVWVHNPTGCNAQFERCSLDALQREVVVMTVAKQHACHLCLAVHTALLHRLGAGGDLVTALRNGTVLPDERLEALRMFTGYPPMLTGITDAPVDEPSKGTLRTIDSVE